MSDDKSLKQVDVLLQTLGERLLQQLKILVSERLQHVEGNGIDAQGSDELDKQSRNWA